MSLLVTGGTLYGPGEIFDPGAVLLAGTKVQAVGAVGTFAVPCDTRVIDVTGQRIIPGLIDLHLHGFGGWDVAGPGLSEVIEVLPAHGITTFLPTTIAAPISKLTEILRQMAVIIANPPPGAQALGIHMEGPWISPKRSGGMRAEFCHPLAPAEVGLCQEAAHGFVRMITVAPEQGEALTALSALVGQGIIASLGHSDADYETVSQAVALGLNHATHTFNAMRPLHQREPGAVGAVLDNQAIVAQLIADGYHVHPAVMRLLIRAKGVERVCIVSDAVSSAGLPPGVYEWDGRRIIRDGDTSRFPDGALAGSAMLMNRMLGNVVDKVNLGFDQALRMATEVPAKVLGIRKGHLAPGYDADVVVLRPDGQPSLTIIGGQVIYQEPSAQPHIS